MSKLEIGYGHNTYAYLAECATCGKPYHPDGNWRTAHTFNEERNIVMWLLGGGDNKARMSLREVILDTMSYRDKPSTWPGITLPFMSYPTNWDGTTNVTCTGIDPAFGINPTAVVE